MDRRMFLENLAVLFPLPFLDEFLGREKKQEEESPIQINTVVVAKCALVRYESYIYPKEFEKIKKKFPHAVWREPIRINNGLQYIHGGPKLEKACGFVLGLYGKGIEKIKPFGVCEIPNIERLCERAITRPWPPEKLYEYWTRREDGEFKLYYNVFDWSVCRRDYTNDAPYWVHPDVKRAEPFFLQHDKEFSRNQ